MDSDLILLERWQNGERSAGEDLFARHFAEIYRFFEHKVGAEAEELTQRTFFACVTARNRFRGHSSFRTYLFAIARNEFYAYLRRHTKSKAIDFDVTSVADIVTSASRKLGRVQEIEQMRAALRSLPAEQQLILELHYWHDLDAQAIAEVFGIPPGTVRVRLLRARRALRDRIGEHGREALANAGRDSGEG